MSVICWGENGGLHNSNFTSMDSTCTYKYCTHTQTPPLHMKTYASSRSTCKRDSCGVFLTCHPLRAVISTSVVQLNVRVASSDIDRWSSHVTQVLEIGTNTINEQALVHVCTSTYMYMYTHAVDASMNVYMKADGQCITN